MAPNVSSGCQAHGPEVLDHLLQLIACHGRTCKRQAVAVARVCFRIEAPATLDSWATRKRLITLFQLDRGCPDAAQVAIRQHALIPTRLLDQQNRRLHQRRHTDQDDLSLVDLRPRAPCHNAHLKIAKIADERGTVSYAPGAEVQDLVFRLPAQPCARQLRRRSRSEFSKDINGTLTPILHAPRRR